MTKLPFCSMAKIMKINYISVLLSFKNMFTFAGFAHYFRAISVTSKNANFPSVKPLGIT